MSRNKNLLFFFFFFFAQKAFPIPPPTGPLTLEQEINHAQFIFVGKVVQKSMRERTKETNFGKITLDRIKVEVEKCWLGDCGMGKPELEYYTHGLADKESFQLGQDYLFVLRDEKLGYIESGPWLSKDGVYLIKGGFREQRKSLALENMLYRIEKGREVSLADLLQWAKQRSAEVQVEIAKQKAAFARKRLIIYHTGFKGDGSDEALDDELYVISKIKQSADANHIRLIEDTRGDQCVYTLVDGDRKKNLDGLTDYELWGECQTFFGVK